MGENSLTKFQNLLEAEEKARTVQVTEELKTRVYNHKKDFVYPRTGSCHGKEGCLNNAVPN